MPTCRAGAVVARLVEGGGASNLGSGADSINKYSLVCSGFRVYFEEAEAAGSAAENKSYAQYQCAKAGPV